MKGKRYLLLSLFAAVATLTNAQIVWLEKDYDFGLMKEAAGPATGSVRLVNRGTAPVSITGARPSCGCTSVEYSEEPIEPGDTAVISFTYDPEGRPGKFEKSIRVYIGENDSYRIGIKGNVLGTPESLDQFYPFECGPLRLSQTVINGGEVTHGSSRNYFVNLYNQSMDSVAPRWKNNNRCLKIGLSEKKLGPGDLATLSIYLNSGQVNEIDEHELPVTVYSGAGEDAAATDITVKVKVTPDFSKMSPEEVNNGPRCYLYPHTIDLGVINGKKPMELSFGIHNEGKSKLEVLRIVPKSGALTVKRKPTVIKPINGRETAYLTLDLSKIPEGPFNVKAEIITNDPLHPGRVFSVVGIKE